MKRYVKQLLLLINALVHCDKSPKMLYYHDIGTKYTPMGTPESLFWSHMECLRQVKVKDYHTVAFDDGFRGIWDVRSRLKVEVDNGLKVIVFIAIDLVGKPGYLTWDEIRTLQNDYGFDFQCHTWSHQTLIGPVNTDLPPPSNPDFRNDDWYHHELVESKNELEKQLGKKVDSLCFPVGYFSDAVLKRCVDAGYTNLYASFPGNLKDDANSIVDLDLLSRPDAICRIIPRNLCQNLSLFAFKCILRGGMNPLRQRYLRMHYLEDTK